MKRDKQIAFRLSNEEMETIRENSEKAGLGITEFCREAVMKGISRKTWEPRLYEYAKLTWEETVKAAEEIRAYKLSHEGDEYVQAVFRIAEGQLREINKKLRYMGVMMKDMEWNIPSYDEMFPDLFHYRLEHKNE